MKDHKIHKFYFCDNFIDFSAFFSLFFATFMFGYFVLFYGRMKKFVQIFASHAGEQGVLCFSMPHNL